MDKFISRIKSFLLILVVSFLLIQLYRPFSLNKSKVNSYKFFDELKAPEKVKNLIQNSCFDCHSNRTDYAWFDYIAPISWKVNSNIKKGKTTVNFSEWKNYEEWRKLSTLSASTFNIKNQSMPPKNYLLARPSKKITLEERKYLINWFENISRITLK
ncbi:heme-binding domain-containing protein [Tenacibaculum xiamenense]|uniref:heme-binding domain-containing protein n=1 Tax=Tenacibaculum xiamenense TaxID=1261553 RepID=UPI0038964852